jgi:hypothetical protein
MVTSFTASDVLLRLAEASLRVAAALEAQAAQQRLAAERLLRQVAECQNN